MFNPMPSSKIPTSYWGGLGRDFGTTTQASTGISYPLDTPSILCHGLACAFRRGEADASLVQTKLNDLIATATDRWPGPED